MIQIAQTLIWRNHRTLEYILWLYHWLYWSRNWILLELMVLRIVIQYWLEVLRYLLSELWIDLLSELWIHFIQMIFPLMSLHITLLTKFFPAYHALVRPLSSMCPQMLNHLRLVTTNSSTNGTCPTMTAPLIIFLNSICIDKLFCVLGWHYTRRLRLNVMGWDFILFIAILRYNFLFYLRKNTVQYLLFYFDWIVN